MTPLKEFRKRLGPAPRSMAPEVAREVRVRYNPLLSTHPWDSLMRVFFDQGKLRERGELAWAVVLQANDFLFAPGLNGESHPATILHAGTSLEDPSRLFLIARRIVEQSEDGHAAAAAMMHPSRRKYWAPVPEALAGGEEAYCSDILVFRKLLPPQPKGATLQKQVFPVLVAPEQTKMVMQVPSKFWPEGFLKFWESE